MKKREITQSQVFCCSGLKLTKIQEKGPHSPPQTISSVFNSAPFKRNSIKCL